MVMVVFIAVFKERVGNHEEEVGGIIHQEERWIFSMAVVVVYTLQWFTSGLLVVTKWW